MSEGQVPITQLSIQDLGSLKQNFENVSLLLKFNTTFPSDDVLLVLVFFIFFFFINAGRETFYALAYPNPGRSRDRGAADLGRRDDLYGAFQ